MSGQLLPICKTTDMDMLKIISFTLAVLLIYTNVRAQKPRQLKHSPVHVGLVYPLSTNGRQAKDYSNSFSLHAITGVSGAETGITLAGFSNHIFQSARGVQLAGFMNTVRDSAAGLQAAGFMNSTGSSAGVTMAGFINVSGDAGTQIGGFMNIAKKVKGVQIAGFINFADSSDYPIALVNIIRNGEKSIGISTDESLTNLVTFRSGSRKLYGILGVGYNGRDEKDLYAWEGGLGAHFNIAPNFRLNTELVAIGLTDFKKGDYFRSALRVLPSLRIGRHVELFAGPSFNYIRSEKGKGAGLVTHYAWSEKEPSGILHGLYFGATGGMNIIF